MNNIDELIFINADIIGITRFAATIIIHRGNTMSFWDFVIDKFINNFDLVFKEILKILCNLLISKSIWQFICSILLVK